MSDSPVHIRSDDSPRFVAVCSSELDRRRRSQGRLYRTWKTSGEGLLRELQRKLRDKIQQPEKLPSTWTTWQLHFNLAQQHHDMFSGK